MGWKARLVFDDDETLDVDGTFSSEEEAEAAGWQASSDYSQGRDVLELAGEDYSDAEVSYIDTWEE